MDPNLRKCICLISAFCWLLVVQQQQVEGRAEPQVAELADQIFDAARQTVTNAAGVAQGVASQAIDAAKNTGINYVDTVQDAAKLGVDVGRSVIVFGETAILRALNGAANTVGGGGGGGPAAAAPPDYPASDAGDDVDPDLGRRRGRGY